MKNCKGFNFLENACWLKSSDSKEARNKSVFIHDE